MPAPLRRTALDAARAQLAARRDTLTDAIMALDLAGRALEEIRRDGDAAAVAAAEAELQGKQDAIVSARGDEAAARDALRAAITSWLADDVPPHPALAPGEDIGRLEAGVPLVLFPVRMETRFDPPGAPTSLKVRVYPDEIFLFTHEKALTPEEQAEGIQFHGQPGSLLDESIHRQRWRDLVSRFGAPRAAYIARAMTPRMGGDGQTFPVVKPRPDHWTRAGEAVLPDRWVVVAYRNGMPRVILGNPIREPLNVTPDPGLSTDEELADLGNDFKIDEELAWTVDFGRAVTAGMAVLIPVTPEEAASGFERVVVIGVKSSLDADRTAALLEEVFDNHHYTRGLGLVPQGTPTNNTSGKPVPFPAEDPMAERSFAIERQPPPRPESPGDFLERDLGDFQLLGEPFGLTNGVFRNVENATAAHDFDLLPAPSLHRALWPATLGYYLQQILLPVRPGGQPQFGATTLTEAERYFASLVRGRGPLPAFRVGSVPYGLLPVISLRRWAARLTSFQGFETLESKMVPTMQVLREIWAFTAGIARLFRSVGNPYDSLLRLLAQDAISKTVQIRNGRGPVTQLNSGIWGFLESVAQQERAARASEAEARRIGQPDWTPRGFAFEWDDRARDFNGPLVADDLDEPLPANYIDALISADLSALREDTVVPGPRKPLLYMLLRHALLLEYQRLGQRLFPVLPVPVRLPFFDIELWFVQAVPPPDGQVSGLFDFLAARTGPEQTGPTVFEATQSHADMQPYLNLLRSLALVPTARLHALFAEALDLCSHRLDAWITALATRRLGHMRGEQFETFGRRRPSYLGGYGWLEDVRPGPHTLRDVGGAIGSVEIQPDNGGFVHAPSLDQARAASLLRAGRMAGRLDGESKYAIDLSSGRARRARRVIQEVRQGQPLGALLGYQIERGLSDSGITALQPTLHALRNRFPLVANKAGDDPYTEIDTVAARSVVDGNLLLSAYKANLLDFAADPALPRPGTLGHTRLVAELERLRETMDAVADLVHAEAVYQVVQDNVPTAQANLDFLPHGLNPPEPEIVRLDGGGLGVTHRVAVLFTSSPPAQTGWPAATARSTADPLLDAWASQLLGDPTISTATVSFKNAQGVAQPPRTIRLDEIGLRPLDLVALALAAPEPNQGSLIDRRFLTAAFQPGWQQPTISYEVSASATGPRSIPEVMEVARALGDLLAAARPLTRGDLHTPLEAEDAGQPPPAAVSDLVGRVVATRTRLTAAVDALAGGGLRAAALTLAAQFLPSVLPVPGAAEADLAEQATGVLAELRRRRSRVEDILPPDSQPAGAGASEAIAVLRQALRTIFGSDFVALAGLGTPPSAAELQKSLDARSTLLGDEGALDRFLQQTARVREGVGRWRRLALYARAVGRARPRADLVQMPHVPGESWIGETVPASSGRISFVLIGPTATSAPPTSGAGVNWTGLFIDEWVEAVPKLQRETGVGFHYDFPNAEAPQAVLVAVPASTGDFWKWDDLLGAVNETLDLAHIRTLEPRHLPLGQSLPAVYLASNAEGYAASTTFFTQLFQAVARSA